MWGEMRSDAPRTAAKQWTLASAEIAREPIGPGRWRGRGPGGLSCPAVRIITPGQLGPYRTGGPRYASAFADGMLFDLGLAMLTLLLLAALPRGSRPTRHDQRSIAQSGRAVEAKGAKA